eukprot:s5842_g2.t1
MAWLLCPAGDAQEDPGSQSSGDLRRQDKKNRNSLLASLRWDALFDAAEVRVPLRKASSCPKLPSWGPDQQGYPLWAPTPVLRRPPPPKGAPPNATRLREAVTEAPLREKSRSKAPQLNGEPYLKAIQDFASSHQRRAAEVLGPRAGEKLVALTRKGPKVPAAGGDVLERIPSDEEEVARERLRLQFTNSRIAGSDRKHKARTETARIEQQLKMLS